MRLPPSTSWNRATLAEWAWMSMRANLISIRAGCGRPAQSCCLTSAQPRWKRARRWHNCYVTDSPPHLEPLGDTLDSLTRHPMVRPWLKLLDPGLTALKAAAGTSYEDRLALARAFNSRARHDEAREILDQLLAEDRAHAEAWFERLLCFSDHDGDEEGLELQAQLESLRDEDPRDGGHLRNLAYLHLLMQDPDGAERPLRQALTLNGQDAKALELSGLVQLHLNHAPEAKAWLLKALSLN